MALYVVSIYLRTRNLKQDMTMLEELDKSAEIAQPASVRQAGKNQAKPAGNQPARVGTRKTRKNY
jgi:hypothetical protein